MLQWQYIQYKYLNIAAILKLRGIDKKLLLIFSKDELNWSVKDIKPIMHLKINAAHFNFLFIKDSWKVMTKTFS